MPRSQEQIETELDAWTEHRNNLNTEMDGLKASLESLRNLFPSDGTFPPPEELTTRLNALSAELEASRAEITAANSELTRLNSEVTKLRAAGSRSGSTPAPNPRNGGAGARPAGRTPPRARSPEPEEEEESPAPPPEVRTTRSGLRFL